MLYYHYFLVDMNIILTLTTMVNVNGDIALAPTASMDVAELIVLIHAISLDVQDTNTAWGLGWD